MVGGEQSLGVGATFALGEADVVDDLAEEDGSSTSPLVSTGRSGLGELPGDTADLDDRQAARIREDDRHLEDDAELVADRVGGAVERFGAVRLLGAGTLHLERHGPTGR